MERNHIFASVLTNYYIEKETVCQFREGEETRKNEQINGLRAKRIFMQSNFVGTVLNWHKSVAFCAKRLEKVSQEHPCLPGTRGK